MKKIEITRIDFSCKIVNVNIGDESYELDFTIEGDTDILLSQESIDKIKVRAAERIEKLLTNTSQFKYGHYGLK